MKTIGNISSRDNYFSLNGKRVRELNVLLRKIASLEAMVPEYKKSWVGWEYAQCLGEDPQILDRCDRDMKMKKLEGLKFDSFIYLSFLTISI